MFIRLRGISPKIRTFFCYFWPERKKWYVQKYLTRQDDSISKTMLRSGYKDLHILISEKENSAEIENYFLARKYRVVLLI